MVPGRSQLRPKRQRGLSDGPRSPSWAHTPDSPCRLRPRGGFWMRQASKQTAGPMATPHSQEHPRASKSKSLLTPLPFGALPTCRHRSWATPLHPGSLGPGFLTLEAEALAQQPAPPLGATPTS